MVKSNSLAELANLGPKSRKMLAAAGITSLAQLRELDLVVAYAKVRRTGSKASLNLLWAIEGALSGMPLARSRTPAPHQPPAGAG
jgi:DNA transformation protein